MSVKHCRKKICNSIRNAALGTDLMFVPMQMKNQNSDILKLKAWMTSAEALKLVTHGNALLLALPGPRNL